MAPSPPPESPPQTATADSSGSSKAQRLRLGGLALLVIVYAGLSHYSAESPNARGLGAALSIGPVLLIAILVAWRWTKPLTALLITALLGAAAIRYWAAFERHFEWADLVQQCAVYALVAVSFARSLVGGRVPLCTQLAERIHGELTPVEVAYTRRATFAWVIFYASLTCTILALFFTAPLRVWSMFVNFGTFALMILMGIADHVIRRRYLPRHPAGGLLTIVQRALMG